MNREEAIRWIKQICAYLTAGNPVWRNEPIIESCNLAIKALEQLEQKKGKWIGIDDYPYESWECDQCGCIYEEMPSWTPNYCPNCGSDMRGET